VSRCDYHDVMLRVIKYIITSVIDGLCVDVDIDQGRAAWRFIRLRARSTTMSTNRMHGALRGRHSTLPVMPLCATRAAPPCAEATRRAPVCRPHRAPMHRGCYTPVRRGRQPHQAPRRVLRSMSCGRQPMSRH
jgi:hypothetical protein